MEPVQAINALVPFGTNLTSLIPEITVSEKATVSPSAGVPQDFTSPVSYTVTDQYGTQKTYIVTITTQLQPQSPTEGIMSFGFPSLNSVGTIDGANHLVTINVPQGSDVSYLTPTINFIGWRFGISGFRSSTGFYSVPCTIYCY